MTAATVDLRTNMLTVGFDAEADAASGTTAIAQALRASGYEVRTSGGAIGPPPR